MGAMLPGNIQLAQGARPRYYAQDFAQVAILELAVEGESLLSQDDAKGGKSKGKGIEPKPQDKATQNGCMEVESAPSAPTATAST